MPSSPSPSALTGSATSSTKPSARPARPEAGPVPARHSLSHLDATGQARMVDVSQKRVTLREARATARVVVSDTAFAAAAAGDLPNGDLLSTVRLAGAMPAQRPPALVPMRHPPRRRAPRAQ